MGKQWIPPASDEAVDNSTPTWTPPATDEVVQKKNSQPVVKSTSGLSQIGGLTDLNSLTSGKPKEQPLYSPVIDPAYKQQLIDNDNAVRQQKVANQDAISKRLNKIRSELPEQAQKNWDKAVGLTQAKNPDELHAPTQEEIDHYNFMQTPVGKTLGAVAYLGSKASKGTLQVAKGLGHYANMAFETNPGIRAGNEALQGEAFNKVNEAANFGLTNNDQATYDENKLTSNLGGLAEFAPAAATSASTGGATLFLQGAGQAQEQLDKAASSQGIEVNPLVKEAFIGGTGLVNKFLMHDLGNSIFNKLPAGLRGDIAAKISADAIKEASGKELTGDAFNNLLQKGATEWADKVAKTGMSALEKTSKAGVDLSALATSNFLLRKGVDVTNGKPIFHDKVGDLAQNISDIATKTAPIFGGLGSIGEATKLTPYSTYKNSVVESLMADPSEANVNKVKQDIATHVDNRAPGEEWTQPEIDATLAHVDKIANVARKLPRNLPPSKVSDAVDLVNGRDELQSQLTELQKAKEGQDPAIADIPSKGEELLINKIDQANDKLKSIVSGKKVKYEGDEETGKYVKILPDGKKENITKSRFDLEQLEKPQKPANEQATENLPATPQTPETSEQPAAGSTEEVTAPVNESPKNPIKTQYPQTKPLGEMSSDELRDHAKDLKKFYRDMEDEFFGPDGAKEYRDAQAVSNSDFASSEKRKEAYKIIDKYHAMLSPEQEKALFGNDGKYKEPSEINDIARHVNHIENSDTLDDLAGLIKNPLLDFAAGRDKDATDAILKAAGRRAMELNIPPQDMIREALEKIGDDLPGERGSDLDGDKALLTGKILKKFQETSTSEIINDNQKLIGNESTNEESPNGQTQSGESNSIQESGARPAENGEEGNQGGSEVGQSQGEEVTQPSGEVSASPDNLNPTPSNEPTGDEVKKTILTTRAYEGTIAPEVKKYLEEKGLTRKSFSQEERSKQATDVINKFGDDAAYQAVKSGDIDGGMAASILAQLQIKNSREMSRFPEGSEERDALAKKQADIIALMEKKGYLGGEFNGQLAHEYENAELDFANVKQQVEKLTGKTLTPEQEQKVKTLTSENERLQAKLKEAEAKLIEETDKAFDEDGWTTVQKKPKTEYAKKALDAVVKVRAKIKANSYSDATGIVAIVDSGLATIEAAIRTGMTVTKAIEKGIEYIKSELKKNGADVWEKEDDFRKDVTQAFSDEGISDKKKATTLEDLQKMFVDKTDNKFSPEEARSIWEYMKKQYISNGTSFRDAISKTSEDLGLSWRQISEAITTPKNKRVSDEMWKRQSELARNRNGIKSWIGDQNKSAAGKALQKASGLFRGVSVFGHGGIFIGTHAGMTVFNPSTWRTVIPAFIKAWKFAYGNEGNYQRAMEELKNSPNYIIAQRAGLKNNPERLNSEEYQNSQKYLGKLGVAGERGFNAIKVLRQGLFDREFNKLSQAEKDDPAVAKSIAHIMNLATGATDIKIPKWVNEVSFAGGMEASRWQKLTQNPAKATEVALNSIFNPSKVTAADKVFAKVWSRRVGEQLATYTAALLANAALQNTLNPKNPVNITNPDKPDFLKFKMGDMTIDPTSGMRSTANFMYTLGKIPFESKKDLHGSKRISVLGKDLAGYGRGKLAPFYSTGADFFTGQDYNGNVMPYSKERPSGKAHKLTWGEYAWSKAPLPVAEAANVAYKSALEHGAHKVTLDNILKGIMSGAISGGTGFRVGEYDANAPENKHHK